MEILSINDLNDTEKRLVEVAFVAREKAYSPINNIYIGAAVFDSKGEITPGANYGISSGLNICAERAAIVTANSFGHFEITKLALASQGDEPLVSCGPCRQFIFETGKRSGIVIQIFSSNKDGSIIKRFTIDELYPFPYSRK